MGTSDLSRNRGTHFLLWSLSTLFVNPLRANYCHTWHMENHPFLWRRIRPVRRIQVCMARKGLRLKPCFFHRLGGVWLQCLVSGHGESTTSRTSQKKLYTKISQSASQLKILEQKRPALSERNACCRRHAVIGPCERVRVAIWGSH